MPQSDHSVQPKLPSTGLENNGIAAAQSVSNCPSVEESCPPVGKVYLVGAGPGDPGLITVRGTQCLEIANVVLYDGLANPRLLDFARQAEKISVGKHGAQPIWSQNDINREMVRWAKLGKTVVRLKGGDPAIFARTAEELEALEAHQIPFEVVPGITAALAVAGYTGIPLTHRNYASAVALVTGQQSEDAADQLDWPALAKFPGTLVIYMGVTTSQSWTQSLVNSGKSPETPVAIVRRCTWGDQLVIRCKLAEVAQYLTPAAKMRPPVLVVVGDVSNLGASWNWFERLPLRGQGIWLPRPATSPTQLRDMLENLGATVYADPVIELRRPTDSSQLQNVVQQLLSGRVQGMAFSSVNGVDYLVQHLFESRLDVRVLSGIQLATVGAATSQQLEKYGLRVDIQPEHEFSASGLLRALSGSVAGQHWVVITTNLSQGTLLRGLQQSGARVTSCLTYETVDCQSISEELARAFSSGAVHQTVITSSHIARVARCLIGEAAQRVRCIALGGKVAKELTELGWAPAAVTEANTSDAIVQSVLKLSKSE